MKVRSRRKSAEVDGNNDSLISRLRKLAGFSKIGRASFGRGRIRKRSTIREQRVTVQARIIKSRLQTRGKSLRRYFQYLTREGSKGVGQRSNLISIRGELSREEREEFIHQLSSDRHHFRFIISPERGGELNLDRFARDLVSGIAADVQTKLEFAYAIHKDTEHPHIHLVIGGRDSKGQDLVLSREYISNGIRALAKKLATEELGERSVFDVVRELESSITKESLTAIDRSILRDSREGGVVDLRYVPPQNSPSSRRNRILKLRRLKFVSRLGLCREVRRNLFLIDEAFEEKLRALGLRGDRIKEYHKRKFGRDGGWRKVQEVIDQAGKKKIELEKHEEKIEIEIERLKRGILGGIRAERKEVRKQERKRS